MTSIHAFRAAIALAIILPGTLAAAASGSKTVEASYARLLRDSNVAAALKQLHDDDARTLREQIEIAQIPAPSFKEAQRGKDYARRLRELGLTDVSVDSEGNVIGRRKGARSRPMLVVSAHLDTVFPEGTDVTVRKENGRYFGKGFVDDSRGLATNLSVLRALQENHITTSGDILFVGTVGEEGLGNLRGVKALLRDRADIDGFISVDGVSKPVEGDSAHAAIITQATGSRRWKLKFTGPGGHSFDNFGLPSAIHAMGRAIARISDLHTSEMPRTTFTVGVVSGGTSVNTIAPEAEMLIDMRSNEQAALLELEQRVMAAADGAVADENARWNSTSMRVSRELVGDRPAASASNDQPIVHAALQAWAALGQLKPELVAASTDSNVAISLGIPAVTLEAGGIGEKFHSPDEWYEPKESWLGPQTVMLTALALVGVERVSKPALPVRSAKP